MNYLCYPYGFFDKRVIAVVKKADYKMAFAIFDNVPLWHINLLLCHVFLFHHIKKCGSLN